MPRKPQRICKHGSSASVVIPLPILRYLRWEIGDLIVPELLDDRTVRFRPVAASDLVPDRVAPFLNPEYQAAKA